LPTRAMLRLYSRDCIFSIRFPRSPSFPCASAHWYRRRSAKAHVESTRSPVTYVAYRLWSPLSFREETTWGLRNRDRPSRAYRLTIRNHAYYAWRMRINLAGSSPTDWSAAFLEEFDSDRGTPDFHLKALGCEHIKEVTCIWVPQSLLDQEII
jgi:hypothetical protein